MAPEQVCTVGTAGYLIQIALFYLCAGLLKHKEEVWTSGRALEVFLGFDSYTTEIGHALAGMPALARFVTYFTLVVECAGPILLFCPFFTRYVRTLMVIVFVGFHLGIQITIHIGVFEILSIVAVSAFVPGWALDRIQARFPWREWGERFHLAVRAWAIRRFGPHEGELAPAPVGVPRCWLLECTAAVLLLLVCWFNFKSVSGFRHRFPVRGTAVHGLVRSLNIDQTWRIFTAIDTQRQGWYLVVGECADGRKFDVLQNRPFTSMDEPEHFASTYDNHNWRRYWNNMVLKANRPLLIHLARYVYREWIADGGPPFEAMTILHVGGTADSEKGREASVFLRYEPKRDG